MFSKLKEQGTKLLLDELSKHDGLNQKIDDVTNVVKAGAQKIDLEQKASSIINSAKTVANKYGLEEKANAAIKLVNNTIITFKILIGVAVLLFIVGIVNGSVGFIILGILLFLPSVKILLKLLTLKKQAITSYNHVNTTISLIKELFKTTK